jgi:hypothetical protein
MGNMADKIVRSVVRVGPKRARSDRCCALVKWTQYQDERTISKVTYPVEVCPSSQLLLLVPSGVALWPKLTFLFAVSKYLDDF